MLTFVFQSWPIRLSRRRPGALALFFECSRVLRMILLTAVRAPIARRSTSHPLSTSERCRKGAKDLKHMPPGFQTF